MVNFKKYLDLSYNDIRKLEGDEKDIAYSCWKKIQIGIYAPLRDELVKRGHSFEISINKTTIRELLIKLRDACEEAGISKDERDAIINNLQEENERRKR